MITDDNLILNAIADISSSSLENFKDGDHSSTITSDFISQKVANQLRCDSVERKRKRSKLDADYGNETSTDSTSTDPETIVRQFRDLRRKVNSELFGFEDSESPGQNC